MIGKFFKRIMGDLLTDLGNLEGDYRFSQLRGNIKQSLLHMVIISVSVLAMLKVDVMLFGNRPNLFMLMLFYRAGYVLVTFLVGVALYKTGRVRNYDRLIFGWMFFTILFLALSNFTRPVNYLTTSFDIIIPFAIYMLSPLRIKYTVALAIGFSAGTMYVDHVFKFGVDPIVLTVATAAQFIVHVLGWSSAVQLQSYRRKSFQAYVDEKDAKEMVAYLANIDPLTKSLTRRQFMNIAGSEFRRFSRYHRPLSILILDADYFKQINDTYGHHAGVARGVAMALALAMFVALMWVAWRLLWPLPRVSGHVRVAGSSAAIEILRDEDAVPHIRAGSEADALFGLGYAHAQDRLWQMEFQRRLGHGRLAEFLGPAALPSDRLFRTIGLTRHARAVLSSASPSTRAHVDAYVRGINAFLAGRQRSGLPFEFGLLGVTPEPWQPEDVIVSSSTSSPADLAAPLHRNGSVPGPSPGTQQQRHSSRGSLFFRPSSSMQTKVICVVKIGSSVPASAFPGKTVTAYCTDVFPTLDLRASILRIEPCLTLLRNSTLSMPMVTKLQSG